MITDDDVKKLKKTFATKDDLQKATTGLVRWTEMRDALEELESRINRKLNKIIDVLDGLVGEVKNYREEQTVVSGTLSDHEDRLTKIEAKLKN